MTAREMMAKPLHAARGKRIDLRSLAIDREAVLAIAVAFLVTRVIVFLTVFVSMATLPVRNGNWLFASPNNLLIDGLVRFDSWWYRDIALNGYRLGDLKTGEQGTVAFFPLYPLLTDALAAVTGNVFTAGLIISNVSFLAALTFLYLWARREFDNDVAGRFVFYLAAAPTAVFFSAMYTESLYLALVAATFYFASRGRWAGAAIAAALASATRNTGVILAVVIALEGLHQAGVRWWVRGLTPQANLERLKGQVRPALRAWPALVAAACAPLGLLAYMAYLANAFGDPLAFIHAQATWGRETSGSGFLQIVSGTREQLRLGDSIMAGQLNTVTLLDIFATIAFLPIVALTAIKLRPAYAWYALLSFLIPLSTGSVGSMTRYILMLAPCFLLLAVWGRRGWLDRIVLGISLPMMAYFAIVFSHWYFAG